MPILLDTTNTEVLARSGSRYTEHLRSGNAVFRNNCLSVDQVIGAVFFTGGFFVAVAHVADLEKDHVTVPHAQFGTFDTRHAITANTICSAATGLAVLVLGWIQILLGFLRPHKEAGKARKYWEWAHKALGRGSIVLAVFVIFTGTFS